MFISEFFDDTNFWLGIVYSAHLLGSYFFIIRIDHFKNDGDRSNWFETF